MARITEEERIAATLRKSLLATRRGLASLLSSLQGSGLRDSIGAYQEMTRVLLQQRLWSEDHHRQELRPLWAELAATARAICEILEAFTAAIGALRDLDRPGLERPDESARPTEEGPEPEPEPDRDPDRLLALMFDGCVISHTQLARRFSWDAEERRARLGTLAASGVLEAKGWGRSRSYRLAPRSRALLAGYLKGMLPREATLR